MTWIRLVAIASLVSAIVLMALVGWTYRRDRARLQNVYTRTVKQRDISDTARKSLLAPQDSVVREHGYVLTGRAVHSEASAAQLLFRSRPRSKYAQHIREWQEFGTLEVVAESDAATAPVRDLSETAKRIIDGLAASVSDGQ